MGEKQELEWQPEENQHWSQIGAKVGAKSETNQIYVIIHKEKTFQVLYCQMCGKYLKKRMRIS